MIKAFVQDLDLCEDGNVWALKSSVGVLPSCELEICKTRVGFTIDTGASCNVLDEETWLNLKIRPGLNKSLVRLFAYGSTTPLPILGEFKARTIIKGEFQTFMVLVVKGARGNVLGHESLVKMGIVSITLNQLDQRDPLVAELAKKYPNVFSGRIGKLKGRQVMLHIKKEIKPVRQRNRHASFHLRDGIEKAIQLMLENDIIEKSEGPTPWVSQIVPIMKESGEIRICLDSKMINTAIERQCHSCPTAEEIAIDLNEAKVISKFDLKNAFNQYELAPECRYITVFYTHMGLYRFKRLCFGINCAPEVFQKFIEELIGDLKNVCSLCDDLLVYGRDQAEHDVALHAFLSRLESSGLTVNVDKCEISKKELDFFGLHFSHEGIRLKQSKIDALMKAGPPKDAKQLRSLYGVFNYASKFIKGAATLLTPFRDLMKRGAKFVWKPEHDRALDILKDTLSKEAMGYFDKAWTTELTTDASPDGLGAVLSQFDPKDKSQSHIVLFASRCLSQVERRYSQVEREALAVVWACERLKLYLIGKKFNLIVDNKAIEMIFGNPKSKPSARIERWGLRLLPFSFNIRHESGESNIADYFSRNAINEIKQSGDSVEHYINMLVDYQLPLSIKLEAVKESSNADETLSLVKEFIKGAKVDLENVALKPFVSFRSEFSITEEGLVLKGNLIVIPADLQQLFVQIAHEAHQGMLKTRALLQRFVWFPNLNQMVEKFVKACSVCQANSEKVQLEPLKTSKLPDGPWLELAADFHGPLPSDEKLLVIVDEFSRFPIVKILNSTTAEVVIPVVDEIFNLFGRPNGLKTDNGPPFQSYKWKEYLRSVGVKHKRITPLWPRANGICERFMRNINRVLRNCSISGKNWKDELQIFLRNYRATPHSSTKVAPEQLIFKTVSSTSSLPNYRASVLDNLSVLELKAKAADDQAKKRMKEQFDVKWRSKHVEFRFGEKVLVANEIGVFGKNKSKFKPEVYTVVAVKGSMVTARSCNKVITRNASFFHKYVEYVNSDSDDSVELLPVLSNRVGLPPVQNVDNAESREDYSELDGVERLFHSDSVQSGVLNETDRFERQTTDVRSSGRIRVPPKRYDGSKEDARMKDLKQKMNL
jgi:hypothetical protein